LPEVNNGSRNGAAWPRGENFHENQQRGEDDMTDKVRFGIVGLGMGRNKTKTCAETVGAELVAVCDIWEERISSIREELDVEIERDFERLLERKDIDVVGIWTPSGMHSSMAVQALDAGKHVCMTKPMDIRTPVCDEAIRKADEKGLVLGVDFDSRYEPVNHQIYQALRSGAIGKIMLGDLRMKWFRAQSYYDGGMPEAWRSKLETEGGSLANQAVHYLDLMQWWVGPVVRAMGKKNTFAHDIETEDGTVALLETESGACVTVLTTTCSFPSLGTSIEISGNEGTLSWKNQKVELFQAMSGSKAATAHGGGAYVLPEDRDKREPVDLSIDEFKAPKDLPGNIFEDMIGAVRDGRKLLCDGREGRKSVAILEAVYASSDKGAWVNL
jgi:UDP-N-acetyl-2-amino-2-deoxyglucuronate dehydrogenase